MTTLTSAGKDDVFIAKSMRSGDYEWATQAGGTSSVHGLAQGVSFLHRQSNSSTGFFQDTATFGNTTLTSAGGLMFL